LDPYKAYLQERIDQARPDWIPATVLYREIKKQGYVGGISQLKEYVRRFKTARIDPVIRFETAPGEQLQVDFTVIRRGQDRLLAFVATMGFSRATFVRFSQSERFEEWHQGLMAAFEYFGGVPSHVLFDNAKSVIIERDAYGPGLHRWHAGMLECAREYGFQLRVCRPYRARTKGKVERFNGYLKRSFLIPLAATLRAGGLKLDAVTANREVLKWLNEVANRREHGTTGVAPAVRLLEDQAKLSALPVKLQATFPPLHRKGLIPIESLQHPLSMYQSLLEAVA
jgi:transposase